MKTTTKQPKTKPAQPKRKSAGNARKTPAKKATRLRKERGLSVKVERFCEFMAAGDEGGEAYKKAGWVCSKQAAWVSASRLLSSDKVKARIAALRAPETKAARYSKEEKLAFLASIMRTPVGEIGPDSPLCSEFTEDLVAGGNRGKLRRGNAASGNEVTGETVLRRKIKGIDKLRALELHSKLVGDFEPEKVEVDAGPITLQTIQSIAERIRITSPLLLHKMAASGKDRTHKAAEKAEETTKAHTGPRPLSMLSR